MRVPPSSPQDNQPSDTKSASYSNTTTNQADNTNSTTAVNAGRTLGFGEPTSVLDLRGSPSPAAIAEKPPVEVASLVSVGGGNTGQVSEQFPLDDHVMRSMDWDSIMRELELDDDSAPALKTSFAAAAVPTHYGVDSQLHGFPDQLHPVDFGSSEVYSGNPVGVGYGLNSVDGSDGFVNGGFDFIEDLIRVVDCVQSEELQLAQVVLARLNQRLRSPSGRPLQRAAFYFKEALGSVLTGSTRNPTRLSSWSDIVQRIRAYKEFSGISPIPLFSHFTANQAILDSLNWQSSSPFVHVVDFEIGFGGQYASLMREIAEKSSENGGFLRVTAVVPEEFAVETRLVKENLAQFAADLKIRFQIEFVLMRTFEMLSFKAIRFVEGERTVVLLSPAIFRRLTGIPSFVNDLRRVSQKVVVFVDGEGWTETAGSGSFRREFVGLLEFYTMVLDSLDAAVPPGEWTKKIIEAFVLRPRISEAVEAAAARNAGEMTWREAFCAAGMRQIPLSQFANFQAECLLEKAQVRGFHVAKRQADLVLCWHGRALVATSAWRF
ncbi:PREDICTED: scarecrow-like protein 15 [Tarenaya hassleriana]|uniref:scarecrow-like protein 15 n=1 Tax=Tarenaya hassleriana TaxID=28532 RepID=UPI00053CA3BF|nr:PREDICTED: scarecrow-like protein 15 [Tarenaya hassleriana]